MEETLVSAKHLIAAAILLFGLPANAAENLAEYIRDDPSCRQYNDGCSICLIENGEAKCSTPKIACTITGWVCVDQGGADGVALGQAANQKTKLSP